MKEDGCKAFHAEVPQALQAPIKISDLNVNEVLPVPSEDRGGQYGTTAKDGAAEEGLQVHYFRQMPSCSAFFLIWFTLI